MKRIASLLPLVPLLAVSACVPASPPPAPPPSPPVAAAPAPPPAPALGPDWRDWPLTPGGWSYRREARGPVARFGQAGGEAALTLRCDLTERRLYLSAPGSDASATVRTSSTTRALPLRPIAGAQPRAAAALAPTDPLLDAMAFSRGRFTVERPGRAPLVAPAHAEVGRVVEDCRG